jgi:hypothetical protein
MEYIPIIPDETLTNKIFLIRGQKVMLDYDLANLYDVETRALKQAVKRNLMKFPEDFMFQLNKSEWQELITVCDNLPRNVKYSPSTPFAFSEAGVAMISSVLNSDRAILVNIQIIRVFIRLRQFLHENTEIRLEIEKIKKELHNQEKNMEVVFQYLDELSNKIEQSPKAEPAPRKRIGYKSDDL